MQHEMTREAGEQAGHADLSQILAIALLNVRRRGLQLPIEYEVVASDFAFITGTFRMSAGEIKADVRSQYSPGGLFRHPLQIKFTDSLGKEEIFTG